MSNPPPPPATTPAVGAPEPTLLHDDAQIRIDHYAAGAAPGIVVIAFDPLMYLWPKPPFGLDFLRKQGVGVVAVRRKQENFYQALDRETFERAVRPVLAGYSRVVGYGSSLGAYAALYFCRDLDCEVISSSPRVSVHPAYGVKVWQDRATFRHQRFHPASPARCRAIVFYDPREPTDRRYVEGEVLPQFPQAQVVRVPYAGHPCTQFLGDIGFLPAFVRAVVTGRPQPALDRRRRVQSGTYFQVMADLCARRGRLATADALITRSLELRPENLLALRTRGLVKTLQLDWPQAVASLEAALPFDPADPLTLSMLERARKGLADSNPIVAKDRQASADAPPSLVRRALRWFSGGG